LQSGAAWAVSVDRIPRQFTVNMRYRTTNRPTASWQDTTNVNRFFLYSHCERRRFIEDGSLKKDIQIVWNTSCAVVSLTVTSTSMGIIGGKVRSGDPEPVKSALSSFVGIMVPSMTGAKTRLMSAKAAITMRSSAAKIPLDKTIHLASPLRAHVSDIIRRNNQSNSYAHAACLPNGCPTQNL